MCAAATMYRCRRVGQSRFALCPQAPVEKNVVDGLARLPRPEYQTNNRVLPDAREQVRWEKPFFHRSPSRRSDRHAHGLTIRRCSGLADNLRREVWRAIVLLRPVKRTDLNPPYRPARRGLPLG